MKSVVDRWVKDIKFMMNELTISLTILLILSRYAGRLIRRWYIPGLLHRGEFLHEIVIRKSNPTMHSQFLDFETPVSMYNSRQISHIRVYPKTEGFLAPDFKQWLHDSGPYRIEIVRPPGYHYDDVQSIIRFYFRKPEQFALFKLTWL